MNRSKISSRLGIGGLFIGLILAASTAWSDETCNSPYMSGLIKGQEDFIHVWTLGEKGLGDGSDKLVTIDGNPSSKTYGKVIGSVSIGGPGEPHPMGFPDDPKNLWAVGPTTAKSYAFTS